MELNLVLLTGIGVGLVIGLMLGVAVMCWMLMAQSLDEGDDPTKCPPCGGNCNQGRTCPARSKT